MKRLAIVVAVVLAGLANPVMARTYVGTSVDTSSLSDYPMWYLFLVLCVVGLLWFILELFSGDEQQQGQDDSATMLMMTTTTHHHDHVEDDDD